MQGVAFSELGQRSQAIRSWKQALPLASLSQPTLYIQALTGLFDVYEEASETQEALDLLDAQDGIDQFQSHGVVEFLGDNYARFGKTSEAILLYQQAIKLGGDQALLQQKIDRINP